MFLEDQNDEDFAQNKLQILAELTKASSALLWTRNFFWKV